MAEHLFSRLQDDDVVLDSLPDSVQAGLEVRKRFLASLPPDSGGSSSWLRTCSGGGQEKT